MSCVNPDGVFTRYILRLRSMSQYHGLANAVAEIRNETPENQRRWLRMLLTMLERAGVAVPEVWRCSLEEMD
jgi:hypothetical protein